MATPKDELVKQHDELLAGMLERMKVAKQIAAAQGVDFDAEKWVSGVSSKGQFKFGPPYYVRPVNFGRTCGGKGAHADLAHAHCIWAKCIDAFHCFLLRLRIRSRLKSQPIVKGMPSIGQAVAGINTYELARTGVWVGAYAAVGFAIGEPKRHSLIRYRHALTTHLISTRLLRSRTRCQSFGEAASGFMNTGSQDGDTSGGSPSSLALRQASLPRAQVPFAWLKARGTP